MSESSYKKFWKGITSKMETEGLTAHIFRHNYATLLYYSGISPKMAAKIMGHADTTMIMRVYAHLDEEKEGVADKLNSIITAKK